MPLDSKLASNEDEACVDSIKGLGIDLAYIPWMAKLIEGCDRETLKLLFTSEEIDRSQSSNHPHRDFTVCFATKESVAKALGTGMVGINWNEIEANLTPDKLSITLHGQARIQEKRASIEQWRATWWHWDEYILVHALAISKKEDETYF